MARMNQDCSIREKLIGKQIKDIDLSRITTIYFTDGSELELEADLDYIDYYGKGSHPTMYWNFKSEK